MTEEPASFDEAIGYLRSIDPADIDASFIEFEIMPRTGFGPIELFLPPRLQSGCGQGVWAQQMPIQFAPYLEHLIKRRVASYLEVGAAHGGSFVLTYEILSKFRDVEAAIISMTGKSRFLAHYERTYGVAFPFHSLDSHSPEALDVFLSRQWDHVFLDGDHSRDGMVQDFDYASRSAKMVALHDICNISCRPGMEAWETIKKNAGDKRIYEFTSQYEETWAGKKMPGMGIGLVEM